MKKALSWASIALAIWLIIFQPVLAAHLVKGTGALLSAGAHGVTVFFRAL